jgi:hypothetical protein
MDVLVVETPQEEIIDVYAIHDKPIGKGVAVGDIGDLEHYQNYIESEMNSDLINQDGDIVSNHNLEVLFYFNNENNYYSADTLVIIMDKSNGTVHYTTDVVPIRFEDYPVFLINENPGLEEILKIEG